MTPGFLKAAGGGHHTLPKLIEDGHYNEALKVLHNKKKGPKEASRRNTDDGTNNLPLHVACRDPAVPADIVRALIEAYPEGIKSTGERGNCPIHLLCEMEQGKQQMEKIRAIIGTDPSCARSVNEDGDLPLHVACSSGSSIRVVASLLNAFRVGCSTPNGAGALPLHIVCRAGPSSVDALPIVEALLEAKPESVATKNKYGWLPLHLACYHRSTPAVIRVLLAANTTTTTTGNTDNAASTSTSITSTAKTPNKHGWLPLHCACFNARTNESLDVVKQLLRVYPKAVTIEDSAGFLPLHRACHNCAGPAVIKALLSAYPDGAFTVDHDKKLPVHHARQHDASEDVIQLLNVANPNEDTSPPTSDSGGRGMMSGIEAAPSSLRGSVGASGRVRDRDGPLMRRMSGASPAA